MNRFLIGNMRGIGFFLIILAGAIVPAIAPAVAQKSLIIATGSPSGVYFPLGGAVAKTIQNYVPQTAANHVSTGGSVDNLRMLIDGKADIAFVQADTTWDAYKGYGKFSAPMAVRTIAVFYPECLQLVTLRNSGIVKASDLRGKRVSTGAQGSGTEIWANRLLAAHGLSPERDIVRSYLSIAESGTALKERKIDAFFWAGGIPTKGIADLVQDPNVQLRLLDTGSAVPNMLRKHGPVYTDGQLVANTYFGQTMPVATAEVWTLLVVREDMDEQLVYAIVKAVFEHKSDLVEGHVQAQYIDLANQARGNSPIPFHAGARKYFAEKGLRLLR